MFAHRDCSAGLRCWFFVEMARVVASPGFAPSPPVSETGALLRPEEGSLDHVVPRSRGGRDTWENLVWASKGVNTKKADRLPHEAGLKLLSVPRAPKELPVTALLRNTHGVAEWKLFLKE